MERRSPIAVPGIELKFYSWSHKRRRGHLVCIRSISAAGLRDRLQWAGGLAGRCFGSLQVRRGRGRRLHQRSEETNSVYRGFEAAAGSLQVQRASSGRGAGAAVSVRSAAQTSLTSARRGRTRYGESLAPGNGDCDAIHLGTKIRGDADQNPSFPCTTQPFHRVPSMSGKSR